MLDRSVKHESVIKVQCDVFAACKEEVKAKKRQQRKQPKGLEKRGTNETPIVVLPGYHLETKTPLPNQIKKKAPIANGMPDRVSLWKQERLCPNPRNARTGTEREEKARSTLLSVMTSMNALSRGDEERDAGPGNGVLQGCRGPMNEGAWSIKHSGDVCRGSCPPEEDEH